MKFVIIGIDPGTRNLGLAALDISSDQPEVLGTKLENPEPGAEAFTAMEMYSLIWIFTHLHISPMEPCDQFAILAMERFYMMKMGKTAREIIRLEGILTFCAREYWKTFDEFHLINAPDMKKKLVGDKSASKKEVADQLDSQLSMNGIKPGSDHEWDALACAYYHHLQRTKQ